MTVSNDTKQMRERLRNAASTGFMDARYMVYLPSTHAIPLSLSAVEAKRLGLRVSLTDLEFELRIAGRKESSINSELREVEYFLEHSQNTNRSAGKENEQ